MLVIRVEMWPHGQEQEAYKVGEMRIALRAAGGGEQGAYDGTTNADRFGNGRTGEVVSHPRAQSAWVLVRRMLQAMRY